MSLTIITNKYKGVHRKSGSTKIRRDWHCEENAVDVISHRAESVETEIRKRNMGKVEVDTMQDRGGLRRFKVRKVGWNGEPAEGGVGNS